MHLVVAATQKEMAAFTGLCSFSGDQVGRLVAGVGLMEAGITLSRFLERHHTKISSIVNFGIGGAYISDAGAHLEPLDLCLASREVLGDFGICYGERVELFEQEAFPAPAIFELDKDLVHQARSILAENDFDPAVGTFVTVNGASARKTRGDFFAGRYQAICENMEGAALARAAELFAIPLVEVRAISNLVEDRSSEPWPVSEAAARAAQAALLIISNIQDRK